MKYKNIVLIDFSDCSKSALKFAKKWSIRTGSTLEVIHQLNISSPGATSADSEKALYNSSLMDAEKKMNLFLAENITEGTKPHFSIRKSSLVKQIETLNSEKNTKNFIFLGLKGAGIMKRIFIGSEAINIIENTNNITFLIPNEFESEGINTLNIAVSENFSLNLLEFNLFLKQFGNEKPNLNFFSFSSSGNTSKEIEKLFSSLRELYEDYPTSFNTFPFPSNKLEGIKEIIEEANDQLLVVQRGTRYLTDHLFRTFLINELVYDGKTPLVVLP